LHVISGISVTTFPNIVLYLFVPTPALNILAYYVLVERHNNRPCSKTVSERGIAVFFMPELEA
jgi:hypothetical protein